MVVEAKDLLGVGIFTPSEAAFYARVRTAMMNRWFYGNALGDRVLDPQFSAPDEKIVSFLDFVQVLAIRVLRTRHKVPLPKIRQAVLIAQEQGIPYPFAMRHTTYLFGDPEGKRRVGGMEEKGQSDIVLEVAGRLIQASGQDRRNLVMRPVAELYMKDLYFDPASGLASEYTAWKRDDGRIVMNPHRRFGEPIVESCGYTARTLWEAEEIEGGIDAAAKAYGVENKEVELACEYNDHLLSNAT